MRRDFLVDPQSYLRTERDSRLPLGTFPRRMSKRKRRILADAAKALLLLTAVIIWLLGGMPK